MKEDYTIIHILTFGVRIEEFEQGQRAQKMACLVVVFWFHTLQVSYFLAHLHHHISAFFVLSSFFALYLSPVQMITLFASLTQKISKLTSDFFLASISVLTTLQAIFKEVDYVLKNCSAFPHLDPTLAWKPQSGRNLKLEHPSIDVRQALLLAKKKMSNPQQTNNLSPTSDSLNLRKTGERKADLTACCMGGCMFHGILDKVEEIVWYQVQGHRKNEIIWNRSSLHLFRYLETLSEFLLSCPLKFGLRQLSMGVPTVIYPLSLQSLKCLCALANLWLICTVCCCFLSIMCSRERMASRLRAPKPWWSIFETLVLTVCTDQSIIWALEIWPANMPCFQQPVSELCSAALFGISHSWFDAAFKTVKYNLNAHVCLSNFFLQYPWCSLDELMKGISGTVHSTAVGVDPSFEYALTKSILSQSDMTSQAPLQAPQFEPDL